MIFINYIILNTFNQNIHFKQFENFNIDVESIVMNWNSILKHNSRYVDQNSFNENVNNDYIIFNIFNNFNIFCQFFIVRRNFFYNFVDVNHSIIFSRQLNIENLYHDFKTNVNQLIEFLHAFVKSIVFSIFAIDKKRQRWEILQIIRDEIQTQLKKNFKVVNA